MSQINKASNNEQKNQKQYILEKERKQNIDIINDCKASNYIDKLKEKYGHNKLISSYEEDYTRNNIDFMKLWQRN